MLCKLSHCIHSLDIHVYETSVYYTNGMKCYIVLCIMSLLNNEHHFP